MKQSEINVLALHGQVVFVTRFESKATGKVVNSGTEATIVGWIPPTGIAGYHQSKTPVVLIDGRDELPFSVHEDCVRLV